MGGRDVAPSASIQRRDAAERHNRVLLHALQTAHPVLYRDRNCFIHTLRFSDGGADVTVYLSGNPDPVSASEISLAAQIS